MSFPRHAISRNHKEGSITVTSRALSTPFADLDNTADKVLHPAIGDVVACFGSVYFGNENTNAHVDVGSYVASGPTFTHWGSSTDGSTFWSPGSSISTYMGLAFFARRTIDTVDLDANGELTVRWRYKAGAAKTIGVIGFMVINFGPPDPN